MSLISIERRGAVLLLRLNDPERRNVLSRAMCESLSHAVRAAGNDESLCALVLTGAPPAFCAGADLDDLESASKGNSANVEAVYQSFMDVADCPLPTIAAVNGPAVGAGLNLALACDIRLGSPDARFDTRFLKLGIHPGGGHGWLLLRAVGWSTAARLLLLGRVLGADEALARGLVEDVVPSEHLVEAAVDLATAANETPRELLVETKASLRFAARSGHQETFAHETSAQLRSLQQPAFHKLVARVRARIGSR